VGHPVKTSVILAALANGTIVMVTRLTPRANTGLAIFAAVTVPTALCMGQYAKSSARTHQALALVRGGGPNQQCPVQCP